MTNASIKNTLIALSVFVFSVTLSIGAFAIVAHAQEDLGYGYTGGDGYVDDGGLGWGYTGGDGYVDDGGLGWGYTGGDGYVDDGGLGWGFTGNDGNLGYGYTGGDSLGWGYTDDGNLGYGYTWDGNVGYGYTSDGNLGYGYTGNDIYGTDVYGTDVIEQYGVGYSYHEYTPSYSTPSYSIPSYSVAAPFSFRAPSTYYAPSYPAPAPRPVQQQQQQQQQQQATPINIVNTNNNNNVNNNTNTVSVVVPVSQTPVTYPVQYVYPQPTPVCPTGTTGIYPNCIYPTYPTYPTQNTYCTITASPSSISNGQASYLTWSSTGATSAWLSDGVGVVAVNGSLAVRPNSSKTYTLTVSGYGGTNTCSTYVTVQGTYISLSQIPYTGFDFGPLGNALYWLSLLSFAAAGAYLVVYYVPSTRRIAVQSVQASVETTVEAESPVETMTPSPIDVMENLPVAPTAAATMDAMQVVHSKEGSAPRIVITRS